MLAIDVTTINQLLSLSAFFWISPLSSMCVWQLQKSDRLYSKVRKKRSLSVNCRYSAAITLCKSSEYCTEIVSLTPTSVQLPLSTILFLPYTEVLSHVFLWHNFTIVSFCIDCVCLAQAHPTMPCMYTPLVYHIANVIGASLSKPHIVMDFQSDVWWLMSPKQCCFNTSKAA